MSDTPDRSSSAGPTDWFEPLYAAAGGDAERVPWASMAANAYLEAWLGQQEPLTGKGRTAVVIGCGLGDDAELLAAKGFEVTAFDISPSAIAWCKRRFPDTRVDYRVADLFAPESSWQGGFDFTFESITIQALPLSVRQQAMAAVARLVAVGGTLLVVTYMRSTEAPSAGPPWPLSARELAYFQELGLELVRSEDFSAKESKFPQRRRVEYRHSAIANSIAN